MIFSLQKRFLVFLLLPVVLIVLISGVASFFYARSYLLDEWTATTKLRLEWTAHQIQMRLDSKRELIDLIVKAETTRGSTIVQAFLTQQLSEMPGVRSVELQPLSPNEPNSQETPGPTNGKDRRALAETDGPMAMNSMMMKGMQGGGMGMGMRPGYPMGMRGMKRVPGGELLFDESHNFLSMLDTFGGTKDNPTKKIVVTISFQSFMKGILEAGQWKHSYACLITSDGRYLAHTNRSMSNLSKLGETGDPLENKVLEEMKTKNFGSVFGEGHPPDRFIGFYKVPTTDWYLLLVSRGKVILAPIVRFRLTYTLAGIISLMCVGMMIQWSTRPIAQSITEISEAAEEVENGNFALEIPEDRSDEIGQLKRRFNQMIRGLKQRDLIERTFGRYVDKKIAQDLMNRPEASNLGGEKHVVTILVADLREFTPMAEKLKPEQVIKLLNRHFARMIPVIEKFKGIIVDFYGDSVLVFFNGTESDVRASVANAVNCAFEMQREVGVSSKENEREGLPGLALGIGIHTGEVIVGNIGTETRAKYGIVGSAVNQTDRIQSVAHGGSIIVSENTYSFLPETVKVGPKCPACLKGLNGTRDLYELKE
ncbi:MAG: adenylate/guanylate cyclase domain-containing protein [Desulfomonilaceae bacterium]